MGNPGNIAVSDEHTVADVRDRWVSTDERAHRVRVQYTERAGSTLWRFPGSPSFVKPAKTALKKARCKVGATRKTRSTKVKKGRVIAFARTAGKSIPTSTAVGIKVSRGRK